VDDLLLHTGTRRALARFIDSGSHAVLIHGELGAGKEKVALALAQTLLGPRSLELQPYFRHLSPEGKSIGIEKIRELQNFLQLKTTGHEAVRRVAVIAEADRMTDEAQNALLKALEEPPLDTVIVLTASKLQGLKETILSRVQQLHVDMVSLDDSIDYFSSDFSAKDISWAHTLSDGQVGLLHALLHGKNDHVVASKIELAKQLFTASSFERLCQVDTISKDKDHLGELLYACKRICTSALESAAKKHVDKDIKAWHSRLSLVCDAEESFLRNINPKLLLTDLFLTI
jgi:DNA polymerase III subunit delta'